MPPPAVLRGALTAGTPGGFFSVLSPVPRVWAVVLGAGVDATAGAAVVAIPFTGVVDGENPMVPEGSVPKGD